MVFGLLNENIPEESLQQDSCCELASVRASRTPFFVLPSRLRRQGNYIIWRWNESTLQGRVSEMLYCSQNCQLKGNTWNEETGLNRLLRKSSAPLLNRPLENVFLSSPPVSPHLYLWKVADNALSCWLTGLISHRKPDMLLNVLIKAISWVERMAQRQCKPAQGMLVKKKNSGDSLQHPVDPRYPPPSSQQPHFSQSQMCSMFWSVHQEREPHHPEKTQRWRKEKCLTCCFTSTTHTDDWLRFTRDTCATTFWPFQSILFYSLCFLEMLEVLVFLHEWKTLICMALGA